MTQNPWVTSAQPSVTAADAPAPPTPAVRAVEPLTPQVGVTAPDRVDQLPVVSHQLPARVWVVGVHGGAGETTVTSLIADGRAAGRAWPQLPADSYVTTRVLLVARSNAQGLEAARRAVTHWASGALAHVDLVGLLIVADAPGRLPKPLRHLADHVAGGAPRTWHLPWVDAWRLGEDTVLEDAPAEVRRVIGEISSHLPPPAAATSGIR